MNKKFQTLNNNNKILKSMGGRILLLNKNENIITKLCQLQHLAKKEKSRSRR